MLKLLDNQLLRRLLKEKKVKKKKKSSKICPMENCNNKIHELLGNCKWCSNCYCTEHRIPEAHFCVKIQDCRQNSFNKNALDVGAMKCIAPKLQNVN